MSARRVIQPFVAKRQKRRQLLKRHGSVCLRCRRTLPADQLTLDHIVPCSQGGTLKLSNLQLLCRHCNQRKGIKTTDYRKQR
jgi:5-methylcytosine-specific restriction endonuclease McrA